MKKIYELQSYLTRLRGLMLTLIILCSMGIGSACAEPNDSAYAKAESTIGIVQGTPSSVPTQEGSKTIPDSFMWGVLASAVVAIVALFVFFLILRPRIKISPKIAYQGDMRKEKLKCEVALINKGLFSCNDIRVDVAQLITGSNGEIKDKDIRPTKTYLSMKGVLHGENESVIPFRFQLPEQGIPGQLKISILAKHSVSGVEYAYQKIFKVNDFSEGSYEKGKFINKGNTYKQSVMRDNIILFKWIVPICILALSITLYLLSVFMPLTINTIILLTISSLLLLLACLLIWQLYIHAKADAYSSVIAYHRIEHIERQMLVAILGTKEEKDNLRKSIIQNDRIEDADIEEIKESNDNNK